MTVFVHDLTNEEGNRLLCIGRTAAYFYGRRACGHYCVDEFGPLSLQPYRGKGWFQQRKPSRLHATYTRPHGVKHLLAAWDLKTDKLYGHASKTKKHQDILRFFDVLRRRFPRTEST